MTINTLARTLAYCINLPSYKLTGTKVAQKLKHLWNFEPQNEESLPFLV